ncbi:TipJ family phage tail tip protein [Minwuia thermotolerans]|uniref:TipJ family phage tail tip protein n=1 Tax=Minwuia thermotolerans TaxID=2056226 RepID=UPI0013FD310F|nr:phage tail protein [Minwuia thermotolerans]
MQAPSPIEALKGLGHQLPGFWAALTKGVWRLAWDRNAPDRAIGAPALALRRRGRRTLHVQPAAEGAGRGGTGKLILGSLIAAAAIGAAFFTGGASLAAAGSLSEATIGATIAEGFGATIAGTGISLGQVAFFGAMTALGGISQMMSATPTADLGRLADRQESFLFDQPVNVSAEGAVIPLVYGRPGRTGSVVASSGIAVERIDLLAKQSAADQTGGDPPDPAELFESNATFDPPASGAGGAGGKGGQTVVAEEDPNTVQARETARIVDVIGDGENGGLVDGLKSYFLDGTPVMGADGSLNFSGITVAERVGLPDQEAIPGFPEIETEVGVGVEVTESTPVVRTINDPDADAARVKVRLPALTEQDTRTADLHGAEVEIAIDRKDPGGDFVEVVRATIAEKTTSDYTEAYRVELPGAGPWEIRMRRITPDAETVALNNRTFFSSYTRIIDLKLSYAGRHVIATTVNAEQFGGRVPTRSWDVWGRIVKVPSNYDPFARTYDGVWDGTFVRNWTNNPAWVFYDLLTDGRVGLGRFVDAERISKFDLYAIAQRCDGMVDDGFGGTEPRWTFDGTIKTRRAAIAWLMTVASAWHGLVYWGPGVVSATMDAPGDPVQIVAPANTIDGRIEAEEAPLSAQHSTVLVRFRDPDQDFAPDIAVVEDRARLARFGYRPMELDAFWIRSRGQATRKGRTVIEDEAADTTYTYAAALDHLAALPGMKVRLREAAEVGVEAGGRVKSATVSEVVLDREVTLSDGTAYTLSVILADGSLAERAVATAASTTDTLALGDDLPSAPLVNAVWALVGENDVQGQIVAIEEEAVNRYRVSAVKHDPDRYARIEGGLKFDPPTSASIPSGPLPKISGFSAEEYLYLSGSAVLPAAVLSFEPSQDARVRLYEGLLKRPGEPSFARLGETSSPSFPLRDVQAGIHHLRVRPIARDGSRGAFADFQVNLLGAASPPADVTGFRATRVGASTRLTWTAVADLDLKGYRIRHTAKVAAAKWSDGLDIAGLIPASATEFLAPSLKGTYMIRAVDLSGSPSRNPALIVTDRAPETLNAVATIDEFPELAGAMTDVEEVSGGLQLGTDEAGDVEASGTYEFDGTLDLGEVYTSRITAVLEATGVDLGLNMDEWATLAAVAFLAGDPGQDLADWLALSQVETMAGVVPEDRFSATLQMRTTEDDPAVAPAWSAWTDLAIGDVTARAFQWRIVFTSAAPRIAPRVTAASVTVDMPDRVVSGGDIAADAAGEAVLFSPAFKATPVIQVTGQDMATGDYFEVTAKSRTGFTVRFFDDADTGIARTFDYLAAGYGEVAV